MKTIQGASCGLMGIALLVAISAPGQNLFVSSFTLNKVDEIAPNGTVSTFATGIIDPIYMAFNSAGNLFVVSGSSIIEVTPGGVKSTFASGLVDIGGLAFDSAGDLYVSDFNVSGSIAEFTPGGVESTFATGLDEPHGLAFNSAGDLFAGTINNITEITPGGVESVFVSGLSGGVNNLAFNNAGNLFAAFDAREILEITPNGTQSNFAPLGAGAQMAFNGQGILFVANENNEGVLEYNSSGTQSTFVPGLGETIGLAFQPVPEPSASALAVLGMGAMVVGLRRKAKSG
jgi:glucose/arabinose dehydrogenase